jgi:glycosyltransferase involved in cell wall biosynthesis
MQIAFNLASMDPSYRGGVNSYIQGLLGGFRAIGDSDLMVTLICIEANQHLVEDFTGDEMFRLVVLPNRSLLHKLWRVLAVVTQSRRFFIWSVDTIWSDLVNACDRCDVVYTPTLVLNCFGGAKPTVVSMHDLQHMHFPQYFPLHQKMNRKLYFDATAKHATRIQASSVFIQDDVTTHFPEVPRHHVPVISEGVDIDTFANSEAPSADDIKRKYGLPSEYLFYPAQLWPHKNHITILAALKELKERGTPARLVLTGAKFGAANDIFNYIENNDLGDCVFYLGVVPFNDLIAIYRAARFLIIAALYESNSLPILEAAAAGTAIIASDTPPNRELSADLELILFPEKDATALADIIDSALKTDIRKTITGNSATIRQYSWEIVARKYLALFKDLKDPEHREST